MEAPPAPVVKHPVMYHRWDHITFLHWAYPPSVVQPLLPPGLSVDTINGETWVGLTPFLMQGVRIPAVPAFHGSHGSRRRTCAPTSPVPTGSRRSGSCP